MHKHKACHPKGTIHNKIKMKMILPPTMRTRLLEIAHPLKRTASGTTTEQWGLMPDKQFIAGCMMALLDPLTLAWV